MKNLIGGYRYTYNKTIDYINKNPPQKVDGKYNLPNAWKLINVIVKDINNPKWFNELPNNFSVTWFMILDDMIILSSLLKRF